MIILIEMELFTKKSFSNSDMVLRGLTHTWKFLVLMLLYRMELALVILVAGGNLQLMRYIYLYPYFS